MRSRRFSARLPPGLPGTAGALFTRLDDLFGTAYARIYTLRLDEPTEIVNWKVEAVGPATGLGSTMCLRGFAGMSGLLTQLLVLPQAIASGNHDVAYGSIIQQAGAVHRAATGNDGPTLDVSRVPMTPAGAGPVGAPATPDVLPG